jgi:putative ABC transport system permease protein
MQLRDTISLAFRTVKANRLRSGITITIIAFGIMALVGIITAIEAMNQKFTESFSSMGANGFSIRYRERQIRIGGGGDEIKKTKKGALKEKKSNLGKPITYDQAELFKQYYKFPSLVSMSVTGTANAIVSYESVKTNPNVRVIGSDENWVNINAYDISQGRGLNSLDVESGRNVCILGQDVAIKLFKGRPEKAVDKIIKINNNPFRVLAVLEPKGSTMGFSRDNIIITSYNNVRRLFNSGFSYNINVKVNDIKKMDAAVGEATGVFRPIRRLAVIESNNFVVDKSDSIVETLMNSLRYLTGAAVVIGLITLIGAAIGLMNIMLVAVTERTKEVGLVKALGGTRSNVRRQFLFESIIISLLGAFFGIILGVLVGNGFSLVLNTGFVVPWNWVMFGIIICTIVGIAAGLYPAMKAARLNPIEALRYE